MLGRGQALAHGQVLNDIEGVLEEIHRALEEKWLPPLKLAERVSGEDWIEGRARRLRKRSRVSAPG